MSFKQPPRLQPGDKVAIVSPSAGLPFVFPWVYEQGLKRIKEVFQLEPIEFPTARQSPEFLSKNPQARAEDINAAFADPSIKAIITTIGGNDQIRILPYLNPEIISKNPKSVLGYSDCTNLHAFLWKLGIISYYGGAVMTQFAMGGGMHDYTVDYIKRALFAPAIGQIQAAPEWSDVDLDWADPQHLHQKRPAHKSEGWNWYNNHQSLITGRLWGGCLEILDLHLSVQRYLPSLEQFDDIVLFIETSEEMPSEGFVYRFIAALGELGILQKLKAILMAYPKAQFCGKKPPGGSEEFILSQQAAVKNALKDYQTNPLVVFNMNFGHTDPQMIIPNGGLVSMDGIQKTISFK